MMIQTMNTQQQAKAILVEYQDVIHRFDFRYNGSEVTSSSGRSYQVANIKQDIEGNWIWRAGNAKGMFTCSPCRKTYLGDSWKEFKNHHNVVRLHSSDIHYLKVHPERLSADIMQQAARVFLEEAPSSRSLTPSQP